MPHQLQIPAAVLSRLRAICLDFPEVAEEKAWTGTRWTVRSKNFAHVLMLDAGWPPAYAQASGLSGPACVLTFRLPPAHVGAPRMARAPFFRPVWFDNIAGLSLGKDTDWDDVESLLKESYRVMAPKKLADSLPR